MTAGNIPLREVRTPPVYQRADNATRIAGAIIDVLIFLALAGFFSWAAVPIVMVLALALKGRTPGKQVFNLTVLEHRTGEPARTSRIFVREIACKMLPLLFGTFYFFAVESMNPSRFETTSEQTVLNVTMELALAAYYFGGFGMAFKDAEGRALWDRVAGTCVQHTSRSAPTHLEAPPSDPRAI